MLTHLQLRDLVIVDEAELEFGPGLTALTGETGAGKSIVVDALLLIAGRPRRRRRRAPRRRARRSRRRVSRGLSEGALRWLEAQAIEHDGEVIVRRVIGADGRSRAYVNGQLVPIQALREFAEFLIEIHGQQEFQHLVKRSAQRELLDEHLRDADLTAFAGGDLRALPRLPRAITSRSNRPPRTAKRVSTCCAISWRNSRPKSPRWRRSKSCSWSRSALPAAAAWRRRRAPRSRRSTRTKAVPVRTICWRRRQRRCALWRIRTRSSLQPAQLLSEATIIAREAAEALRHYLDALDMDPARQEQIERHAAALEALARKHRQSVLELPAQLARTEQEMDDTRECRVEPGGS